MEGWILDIHPDLKQDGRMVIWVKQRNGKTVNLVDEWSPSIYVYAGREDLDRILRMQEVISLVSDHGFESKIADIADGKPRQVLRLTLKNAKDRMKLAKIIYCSAPYGRYQIYNADIDPAQIYMYEHDLFPLVFVGTDVSNGKIKWNLLDSVEKIDYELPDLKQLHLKLQHNKQDVLVKITDPIKSVELLLKNEKITIEGNEQDILLQLVKKIQEIDPDVIFTNNGDSFVIPSLLQRAGVYGISENIVLGRCNEPVTLSNTKGSTYFSYGKVIYKPRPIRFYGRIHVDLSNTFVHAACGLEGCIEVSRTCRVPLDTTARASIGRIMTSIEYYHAYRDNILIPWKPALAERFKSSWDLMVGDRGGFIFEPKVGVHDSVGEIDFSSLYPTLMLKKNISAETICCDCCPDSSLRVPELDYNICEKRIGIVPKALDLLIRKRARYKELKKSVHKNKEIYDARQTALKWILVACLPRESPVLIQRAGNVQYVKIGDFIDSIVGDKIGIIDCPSGIFVSGVNHDLRARFCGINKLIKIPNHKKLVSIIMNNGRRIVATPDHPFFVLKNGELKVITSENLNEGDLIPVAKSLSVLSKQIETIDLIEQLNNILPPTEQLRWKVSGSILKPKIKQRKRYLEEEAVREGFSIQAVNMWIKHGILPLRFFNLLHIAPEFHKKLHIGIGRRRGGRTSWFPAIIPVNEELGFFLGLYVSDGSATRSYVRIDIGSSEKDLLIKAKNVVKSLFQHSPKIYKEKKARMYVLQINKPTLLQFLEKIMGLPGSAEKGKLKVPSLAYNSDTLAHGFMQGMVAGDGYVPKNRNHVSIGTASEELANQLGFLAAKLGLGFTIHKYSGVTRLYYTVDFVGPETLQKIASWKFLKNSHLKILEPKVKDLCKVDCAHPFYQLFPTKESGLVMLARIARTVRNPRMDRSLSLCPYRAKQALKKIYSNKFLKPLSITALDRLHELLESDLGFAQVREIKELDRNDKYVYCFQLADNELPGFFTGQGAIYTHNCFGYLGFRNAKFGRIDAHMAVCAFARKMLFDAVKVAENNAYEIVHGIVDSLWLKKRNASEEDYVELCSQIKKETKLPISFEGIYKWVAFLPSKMYDGLPVLNRYFGVFRNGEIKIRGIEARKHDTPEFIRRCQMEMLQVLAKYNNCNEVRMHLMEAVEVLAKHVRMLEERKVPVEDLIIHRKLSKKVSDYRKDIIQAIVSRQLAKHGRELDAGEPVGYVITDFYNKRPEKRAAAIDLLQGSDYDVRKYSEMLIDSANTILNPFGLTDPLHTRINPPSHNIRRNQNP